MQSDFTCGVQQKRKWETPKVIEEIFRETSFDQFGDFSDGDGRDNTPPRS